MTVYFDAAATSFQKPPEVGRAMLEALQTMSSPGRGGYPAAMRAAEAALECRSALQELFHAAAPEQVVFTLNATHALNIAIKSLVRPGDQVVISGYEHNAVTRPLAALGAQVTAAASPLFRPDLALDAFRRAVTPQTAAVICTHVSNVFGFVLPAEEIAGLCRERGVPLILDASQSAGIVPLDAEALGAAYIALPGHKGLYGPQGTGVLLCAPDAAPRTLLEGGTGSVSRDQTMPDFLPDRLEAGTHNMPGICGLLAGVRFVRRHTPAAIGARERELGRLAAAGLREIPGTEVFAREDFAAQSGVVSFRCRGLDAESVGSALAREGVAVRAGLHCAPLAHRTAGSGESGTIRLSFSIFNTDREVFYLLRTLRRIIAEKS
jgi:cysteine desulfurase family protein